LTLAYELTKIPRSEYLPRPEFIDSRKSHYPFNYKEFNDNTGYGAWDILGTYSPDIGIITLYEDNIIDCVSQLPPNYRYCYPLLRELVRLHEHAHAYIHTARIEDMCLGNSILQDEWFKKLPKEINESLTEYIVVSVLKSYSSPPLWRDLFDEIDKGHPRFYRRWKQANRLRRGLPFIAPIVSLCRTNHWKDWDEFYETLGFAYQDITDNAITARLLGSKL